MKRGMTWVVAILVAVVAYFVVSYNGLVNLDEKVNSSWAQVENNLQRRADLIPNLVNTVKGFAKQESDVLLGVTNARAGYAKAKTPGEYAAAEEQLRTSINIAVEAYPQLKSDANFRQLQDELAGTENRLAVARRDYNNTVQKYNNKIRRFPTNILSGMMGFEQREYFQIKEGTEEVPDVKF